MSDASVSVELKQPDGSVRSGTTKTNAYIYVAFAAYVDQAGTYTVTVANVTKDGYRYDPPRNVETSAEVTI